MGGFTVGGVAGGLPSFASTHVREDSPPAPLTVASTRVGSNESVVSDEGAPLPVDPMLAHEPGLCFADRIARPDEISVTQEGANFALRYMHAGSEDGSDGSNAGEYAHGIATADEVASPGMPSRVHPGGRCGKPPLGFGRFSAIALFMCALFCVCANAAPLSATAFAGAGMDELPCLAVGGAAPASPETSSLAAEMVPSDTGGDSVPNAIPPRKHIRYRQEKQRFRRCRVIPLPPALQDHDPHVRGSPPYSPPPYSSEDEAEVSNDNFNIGDSSFCPTNDSTPTATLHSGGTLTVLRAGTPVQPPASG
ncbi:hypothetical protein CYMTET_41186 [Cymbomonas tetramitiformis]|uniref:Uncharacterized protein n=1 Tax=Cymbomonas tetramitiformis TaxID=36881 RepID=A0AAE0F2I3_9CHLO|nr:hypothetical protein CYMTET_41186 [Cymbomonas tetramitiformis]